MKLNRSACAMITRIIFIYTVLNCILFNHVVLASEYDPWISGLGNVKATRASDDLHTRRSTVSIDINSPNESIHSNLSYSDMLFGQLDKKRHGYAISYLTNYMNKYSTTVVMLGIEQISDRALAMGQARYRLQFQPGSTLEIGASRSRVETIRSIDGNITFIEYGVDIEHRFMGKITPNIGITKIHFSDQNIRNQYRAGIVFDLSRNNGTSIQLRRKHYSNSAQHNYFYFNPQQFNEDSVILTTSLSVSESVLRLRGSKGFQRVDQRSKTPTYSLELSGLTTFSRDLKLNWGLARSRIESFGGEAYTVSGINVSVALPFR